MRLATFPIVAALLFGSAHVAWAVGPKTDSPYDRRIKSVVYNPLDTVQVNCVIGLSLTITVAPGEKYVTHAFGDPGGWRLSQKDNKIIIWPMQANSDTNLTLITDRRTYQILLHFVGSRGADNGQIGNTPATFIRTPWAMRQATIALNYTYPDDDRKVAAAKSNAQRVKEALASASDQGMVNMAYSRSDDPGTEDIRPVNVWDNFRFTYFKFPANGELPNVYYINSAGKEEVPNAHVEGANHNILVAENVARVWRIRSKDKVIGVLNANYNPALGASPSGTVSPYVRRVLKQTDGENQ
ncbi:traO protein [Burkholderia pseudomallei]|uniref:TrbG/VirB9 family P-type conjugative transfer protein n=1 Tax=Burkholderia pseudomallei TaxID=28450 RepID=UPI00050DB930|nr:TrbG/VirB9 family P-type conjugative transfer protein [Burkholderia pseudomallei]KGD42887.1 traO protein [Burkholderia pseudomallei]